MTIFGDFLRPAFPGSRVQHVSDLHMKFALRPHHVLKYATAEIRHGKKKKELEMWANSQRDGRPAMVVTSVQRRKVWLTPTTTVLCSVQ